MREVVWDIDGRRNYEVDANRNGENAQICPKCSKDRKKSKLKTFSYSVEKGIGHCNHCGLKVVKKKEYEMPEKKYVRPVWSNVTELPDKVVQWFKGRGISQQTLIDAKVSYETQWMPQTAKESNVICFNYFRQGELINVKYRDGAKNFKLVKDAELIFYGLDDIENVDECVIVEGEMDKLSFSEVGIKNVVSVPNGAAKGSLKLEYLDNCWQHFEDKKKIYLATDDDEAGRILQEELARRLGKERCFMVSFFGCKDANELLVKDRLKLTETIQNSNEYPIEGVYTAKDIESEIWDMKRNGMKPACKIGIDPCDEHLTFEEGYVTLVTGVVGHGKSEFVDQMIIGLNVNHGWKTAFFSPENWPLKYHHSKLTTKLSGGHFNTESDENTALGIRYCAENFYLISPAKDFSLDSILETVRQLVKKHGVKALVIDAWNKLEHLYTTSETQYISKKLDDLDTFAKLNGVHVFLIAHPTKMRKEDDGINYAVPDGYSVSGSAAFYSKPANVICVYRRYYQDNSSTVEIYYQKVKFKHWGKGRGSTELCYTWENGRYYHKQPNNTNYLTEALVPKQADMEFEKTKTLQANTEFETKPINSSQDIKDHQEEEDPLEPYPNDYAK